MLRSSELEGIPIPIQNYLIDTETRIMTDLAQRIKESKEISSTADWQINRLRMLGESNKEVKKRLQGLLKYSNAEINKLYDETLEKSYIRDLSLYKNINIPAVPFKDNRELQTIIQAYKAQTKGEFVNITQTIGFATNQNGKIVFTELSKYYQEVLDRAVTDIATGAYDYNTVLKRVVSEMTSSGLRTATFASGKSFRMESAARMALMTGLSQTMQEMNNMVAKDIGTDFYEIDWHGGARPAHRKWQGRVWSKKQLETVCGLGTAGGLCGVNCYHSYFPFVPGASVRQYTDKQLDALNLAENKPKTYQGKEYTTYEATQRQRQLETLMRKQRQEIRLLKIGGADNEDIKTARARYRITSTQYAEFSNTMEIPQQRDRVTVDGLRRV